MQDPRRENPRRDIEDPNCTQSKTLKLDPSRAMPYTDAELPMRTNPLVETDEAMWNSPRTEIPLPPPNRAKPITESPEAIRVNDRTDNELARLV
jgi:hypothetical protein